MPAKSFKSSAAATPVIEEPTPTSTAEVTGFDPCGMLLMAVASAAVARFLVRGVHLPEHRAIERFGVWSGAATFLLVAGYGVSRTQPTLSLVFDAVTYASFVLAGTWIGLTVLNAVWAGVRHFARIMGSAVRACATALALLLTWPFRMLQRKEVRKERSRQDADAHERNRKEREAQAESLRHTSAHRSRCDAVRARCERAYYLHAPELAERFNRASFDAYCGKYLTDGLPIEELETRGDELLAIIQAHVEKVVPKKPESGIEEILKRFDTRRRKIEAAGLDAEDEDLMLRQLEEMRSDAISNAIRSETL